MRKSFTIFLLLLILSGSLLTVAHHRVSQLQDDIVITETTLAGDPAAADGLTVTLDTALRNQLFWHTVYRAGCDPAPESTFTFSPTYVSYSSYDSDYVYLDIGNINFSISSPISLDEWSDDYVQLSSGSDPVMIRPLLDVAERTLPGETRTEAVRLRDYYQYYMVQLHFKATAASASESVSVGPKTSLTQEDILNLNEYFRILIPEDVQMEVSISKNDEGTIYHASMISMNTMTDDSDAAGDFSGDSSDDSGETSSAAAASTTFLLQSGGLVTEEGFYLVFRADSEDATQAFSEIADGYGVYFIPIRQTEEDGFRLSTDQIQNICPLDPESSQAIGILESQDGTKLLVFTSEQDSLVLTVLDRETWEPLQRLSLPDGGILTVQQDDDILILYLWDENGYRLTALTNRDGYYHLWLDTPMTEADSIYLYGHTGFCFDGQRLALAYQTPYGDSASLCLMVYGQDGLLYAGQYLHSGDQINPKMQNLNWYDGSLTLRWE